LARLGPGRLALLVAIALAVIGLLGGAAALLAQGTPRYGPVATNAPPQDPAGLGPLKVGQLFPEFTVTDVERRRITRETLNGKPAIIWFTTSYCVPCQVGARVVAKLDDELGGRAFTVLVLFVDPNESPAELRGWRGQFARDDWMVALDGTLANRVALRYLDTKYLLDRAGAIRNIDVNAADDRYLDLIRQAVRDGH